MLAVLSIVSLYTVAENRNGMVLTDTQAAIDYLYANGLTKFSTTTSFMAGQSLRRDEAAAFFSRLARDILWITPDTSIRECYNFTDLSLGYKDLQGEMMAWCQLWLFKGSNGKFMPTASFTNAQALTVLIRLIDWVKEESWSHRAENYLNTAKSLWLTNGLSADNKSNLDRPITRWDVAKLIEAGATYKSSIAGNTTSTNNNTETTTSDNSVSQTENTTENTISTTQNIWLNTPFIVGWIEYQILSIRKFDKIGVTYQYIETNYEYPENWVRLIIEYSFKNISSKNWYAGEMRIQNWEDLYDESSTASVYSEEQMGYDTYRWSILEWAKKTTYVWFDAKPHTLEWATLFIQSFEDFNRKNAIKIPLKNFLN